MASRGLKLFEAVAKESPPTTNTLLLQRHRLVCTCAGILLDSRSLHLCVLILLYIYLMEVAGRKSLEEIVSKKERRSRCLSIERERERKRERFRGEDLEERVTVQLLVDLAPPPCTYICIHVYVYTCMCVCVYIYK
jgi:hypothetical protein